MVRLSWHCHCESSVGSFDKHSTSAGRPSTFAPSWLSWDTVPPKLAVTVLYHCHLLLLSPKADARFTMPRRAEGWVKLDAGYISKRFTCPQTVTHPGSNRVRRRVISLIGHKALPLGHTGNVWRNVAVCKIFGYNKVSCLLVCMGRNWRFGRTDIIL